jgi:hypothetical protein
MKRPFWFELLEWLWLAIWPGIAGLVLLSQIGFLKALIKDIGPLTLFFLCMAIAYHTLWFWFSPRIRTRLNEDRINPDFEKSRWKAVLDRVKSSGREGAERRVADYLGELFVRRAYASRRAAEPHPFLDEVFREMTVSYALPIAVKGNPDLKGEAEKLKEVLASLAGNDGDSVGKIMEGMKILSALWNSQGYVDDAAEEVAENTRFETKRSLLDFIPFGNLLRGFKVIKAMAESRKALKMIYLGTPVEYRSRKGRRESPEQAPLRRGRGSGRR